MRRSDFLSSVSSTLVDSHSIPRVTSLFAPTPLDATDADQELFTAAPPPILLVETIGSPRFLGSPCTRALLSDPGGPLHQTIRCSDIAFHTKNSVGNRVGLSRLNHTAQVPPVYASQGRLPATTQHSVPAGGQP